MTVQKNFCNRWISDLYKQTYRPGEKDKMLKTL